MRSIYTTHKHPLRRGAMPTDRFYGNPRRIRNFPTGRCGHRPLRITGKSPKKSVGADDSVRPWEAANSPKIFAFRKCILQGGQSRPPLRNSDYINTNATGLSSSEEGLFLTLVHRIFLNMSLYIHWKHGIICEVSRCGCLCPFARRTMAQYPSQPAGFEEGPKNPLKGTSVKPLVSASYAQSGVDAGGGNFACGGRARFNGMK